ncbi:protoheme IX farnesyltransferase [Salinibacillus kushneri]|uniref:Protoheme IX farnesyltransferase n=1 Tax=Salinibacillus kushneri TaxID=237682 RepID=A0A1I0HQ42_9BACI|nr:heme o synthase [Salinibacillus kushneri]SET86257.1 protoheme IX farnesyltransferase [Salinibacillus kushneri]
MSNPKSIGTNPSKLIESSGEGYDKTKTLWSDFLALIKIGIINSNLMTTFAGFWLALFVTQSSSFFLYWDVFILTMTGTAFVIAGGCVLNNYYDQDIDQKMSRTKERPTVTGTMSNSLILKLGIGFSVFGLILLWLASPMAALFGFLGWFTYVVLYTMWSKRRYTINTIIGSFSGAAPPLIGWFAVDTSFHPIAFVLFLILFIWQTPHFLSLAMLKTEEYKEAGIPMLPVIHGFSITKRQMTIYIACLLPLPFYFGSLGTIFLVLASILNIGWLILSISGFFTKDDLKWAKRMFIYSLNYLTIISLAMVIATIPSFF